VLRAVLRNVVPREILSRRKMGFAVPVGRWFRGPFWPVVREFVRGPRALRRGLFEPSFLRRLAEERRAGAGKHGDRLWLFVNLEIWQRVFLHGEDIAGVMCGGARKKR
jgi:asparagine synthase (glutamine-hydrolysing)